MPENSAGHQEKTAAGPPERVLTTLLMAAVALVSNSVRPSRDEVRLNIDRMGEPYFRAYVSHCMRKVYGDGWRNQP